MSEKQLVKKLASVMQKVKYIQKSGFNDFHKYSYVKEADIVEPVREALSEQNVIMIPSVAEHIVREHTNAKGKVEYIATVLVEFTFMDGDTGETISFKIAGEGQDAGDKGYYKAMTGATKYAIMKAFMIPTGDDPEGDINTDQNNHTNQSSNSTQSSNKASEKQIKKLKIELSNFSKKSNVPLEQLLEKIYKGRNVKSIEELNKKQISEVINYFMKKGSDIS
ncbi:ERF superfamily protein [Mesobacillus persicus]|uniref:ERF superfamily protein n=1 Tax=Mesobacillus persicus TaxID=930146 RepID=A0A1H7XSG4_9BACI|nr:ERF family protein [Mesobacillus persicus]SEM35929.1 ERF superfamily protein [Mesobacillus persicus]